jgi:hypothetical protein
MVSATDARAMATGSRFAMARFRQSLRKLAVQCSCSMRVGMHNSGCIDALGYRVDNAAINLRKEESHV